MTVIADRPVLGMLLMTGFCFLAPLGDGMAKYLGATIPVLQIVTVRFVAQAAILTPVMAAQGWRLRMTRRVLLITLVRTVLHISALGLFFAALKYLPLADAVAILFVMPFMLLLLGKLTLGEEVGPRRLGACAVGFAGTLLVMQPSFLEVGAIVLLPVFVALIFALFMLLTRAIARDVDAITLQAVSGLAGSAVLVPVSLLFLGSDVVWLASVRPDPFESGVLLAMGVLGTLAHLLMTGALRHSPAATLAPMQYLEIPFATLIGWLMFRELPNELAGLGILITVGAGLYIVFREHRISRNSRPIPPLAEPPPGR